MENLYKVGGSHQRLKRVETVLWHGLIDEAKASFDGWSAPQVNNFLAYLDQHRSRLPNYAAYQQLKIDIGSGAVSSTIKRIGRRLKISGAQWKSENVNQVLKQRCAYLNLDLNTA
ncbi:MAG: hypothetical protein GDA56_31555 [Hormoscilla sp. GM7CHS1pb]|nr:hypothetical protein [Hormoscilla sp. GM7CHS1pb]